jgi:hypothetical protein
MAKIKTNINLKSVFLTLFIFFSVLKVEAKKNIFSTEIVIGCSEIIVIGEIENVHKGTYTFRINETLKGKIYKTITVEEFDEWICDARFDKVKKGQKLCLFLKKRLTNWTIINGSTGELSISGDSITLGGYEEYKHIDFEFTPYRLSLNEFKNGIREFCKCYQFFGDYDYRIGNFHVEQISTNSQIRKFIRRSNFTEWLYEKMKRYYPMPKVYSFEFDHNVNMIWDND